MQTMLWGDPRPATDLDRAEQTLFLPSLGDTLPLEFVSARTVDVERTQPVAVAVPEPAAHAAVEPFDWFGPASARAEPVAAGEDPTVLANPRDPDLLERVLAGLRRL
jgi:hypothetical protein